MVVPWALMMANQPERLLGLFFSLERGLQMAFHVEDMMFCGLHCEVRHTGSIGQLAGWYLVYVRAPFLGRVDEESPLWRIATLVEEERVGMDLAHYPEGGTLDQAVLVARDLAFAVRAHEEWAEERKYKAELEAERKAEAEAAAQHQCQIGFEYQYLGRDHSKWFLYRWDTMQQVGEGLLTCAIKGEFGHLSLFTGAGPEVWHVEVKAADLDSANRAAFLRTVLRARKQHAA